ncbi:MAG: hypothetical protein ACI8ZB_004975 [Desulforhopalus sp.]|jgi:hypothetical protein
MLYSSTHLHYINQTIVAVPIGHPLMVLQQHFKTESTPHNNKGQSMSATIEELTINYEEDGVVVVKETGKEVLSKGAWTTILYRFNNLDKKTGEFGKDMYTIRRYQKRQGEYMMKSKFNISSAEQAKKIVAILETWVNEA